MLRTLNPDAMAAMPAGVGVAGRLAAPATAVKTWERPLPSDVTASVDAAKSGTIHGGPGAGSSTAARGGLQLRYANALYSLAEDRRALDEVVDQMDGLGRLIDGNADLRRLLDSPLTDVGEASTALRAALAQEGFGKTVQDFVGVVAANRRLPALRSIIASFARLVSDKRGVVVAEVTTAHELTDLQEQQLRARLIEAGYGSVDIHRSVDPSMLGGLSIRIGARLYDSTVKSRLQRLQYAMKGAA